VGNLRAGHALEERLAYFVWHLGLGQFPLGFTDRADFRNAVDTGWHVINKAPGVVVGDAAGRRTALVEGGAGQARPADHIAGGIDVRHGGAVILVHLHLASAVGLQADVFQGQFVGVAGAPVAPQEGVGFDLLAGLQVQNHTVIHAFDPLVLFVVTNDHVVGAQVVTQRIGDFIVEEVEQLVAVVDQVDQYAQAAEDRGVLGANHPSAVDDDATRRVGQAEDGVAVVDAWVVEVDIRRTVRARTRGN